jgi:OTU domain-containing protein 6
LARIEEALKDVKPQGEEENNRLRSQLQSLGLVVKPVAADGNCLYNSILDQLETRSVTTAAPLREQRALRALIADHMRAHRADYAAFVTDTDTDATSGGDKRDAFEAYCDAIVNTVSWGGQLEVRACVCVCFLRKLKRDRRCVQRRQCWRA